MMGLRDWSVQKNVSLLHFPELDEVDEVTAQNALDESYARLSRHLPGAFEFALHAKRYNVSGGRRQHELHARLLAPHARMTATATEWNFLTALQSVLSKLEKEARKSARRRR